MNSSRFFILTHPDIFTRPCIFIFQGNRLLIEKYFVNKVTTSLLMMYSVFQMSATKMSLESDKILANDELKKKQGQLLYLEHLAKVI